jgi:hypothetical protein
MTDRCQNCFRKSQLATPEIQRPSLAVCQGPLHGRRDSIADLLSFTESLNQSGISKNAEVMGDVRLRTAQLPYELGDAFFFNEQGFQEAQTGFVG